MNITDTIWAAEIHRVMTKHEKGRREGYIVTPLGIVAIYEFEYFEGRRCTDLDFAFNGKQYRREINRLYTLRGLSTVAHRFAKEVVAGEIK